MVNGELAGRIRQVTITAEPAHTHEPADVECDLPPSIRRARIGIDGHAEAAATILP